MPERPDPSSHDTPGPGRPDPGGDTRNQHPNVLDTRLLHEEMSVLRERVHRLSTANNTITNVIQTELRPGLAALAAELDKATHGPTPTAPVNWPALDAEQAGEQWPILANWIDQVLVPSYELTRAQLPDCWAAHPPAVIELSWLHAAHAHAYQPHCAPALAGEWHCRWRDTVLDRLTLIIPTTTCRPGEHLINQANSQALRASTAGPPRRLEPWETSHTATALDGLGQRAVRRHWQNFYNQAVQADLARRRPPEHNPHPPNST